MLRRLALTALPLAALAILPTPASAAVKFRWGVVAGEIGSSSAILWSKASKPGRYTVRWGTNRALHSGHRRLKANKAHDNTMRTTLRGLKPAQRYYYRFTRGRARSDVGTFTTTPTANADKTIHFAWSGDMDATAAPGKKTPYWNNFGVLAQMAKQKNDFNIMLGDTIYSDTEVPGKEGKERAISVKAKHAKYRLVRQQRNEQIFTRGGGTYWQWDDHEFINDFSPAQKEFAGSGGPKVKISGKKLYKQGRRAFLDYTPVKTSKLGLYRTVRWGKNLELFILDERSFRSALAANDCINPQSGEPDLAPTAPPRSRQLFSFVAPSLSAPVSQSCLDTIRSPQRTMLGAAQWARFQSDIMSSNAVWKVVVSEMEAKQYYALPYDRWEGYESDRQKLLNLLSTVDNTVLLATDVHANLAVDARFQTLEDSGAMPSGVFEMSTGPVATKNYNLEISDATGNSGAGDLVSAGFLKPPPPNGIGMDCAATKSFSYGQVTVTPTQLMLAPFDIDGNPVMDDDGTPCGPFTLTAK